MTTLSLPSLRYLAFLALFTTAAGAQSSPPNRVEIIPIPLAKVFVPAYGYDDNDSIEVVLDGYLPNSCYSLERHQIDYDAAQKRFTIRQYAIRQLSGICDRRDKGGSPFESPIPFTETITLGRLAEGRYRVSYSNTVGTRSERGFAVQRALEPTADSRPYAMVRSVDVPAQTRTGRPALIQIVGILNNSCYELNDHVETRLVDDVAIVLPTVRLTSSGPCLAYIRPFSVEVEVGPFPTAGRYLVHVRSMHGKSVNAAFTATESR